MKRFTFRNSFPVLVWLLLLSAACFAQSDRIAQREAEWRKKLSNWIFTNLKWRNIDPGDASHTLALREATCLEFSELFVAMARSLGLPARMVSGMAYSDGSFGGHAWVEVYAGKWVEIDPTWGTDYVATHLRESANALRTYAALSLASIEVVDAPHAVASYQRDPAQLAAKICEQLPKQDTSALAEAMDLPSLADRLMGPGSWASFDVAGRAAFNTAFRRVISSLAIAYREREIDSGDTLRVLKVSKQGDDAYVMALAPSGDLNRLIKMTFRRRGEVWTLVNLLQFDRDFDLVSEAFGPAVQAIKDHRAGIHSARNPLSVQERLWTLYYADKKAAIQLADEQLRSDPANRDTLYVKALCMLALDQDDDGAKLLSQLADATPPFAPAIRQLALNSRMDWGDLKQNDARRDAVARKTIELFRRYIALVPYDPRPNLELGDFLEQTGDLKQAESLLRTAAGLDPAGADAHPDLAVVLAKEHRFADAIAAIDAGPSGSAANALARVFNDLDAGDDLDAAEGLSAEAPDRLDKNYDANLSLARLRIRNGLARQSLPLLKKAAALDPKILRSL